MMPTLERVEERPDTTPGRMLIVMDECARFNSTGRFLDRGGYQATCVSNDKDALEVAQSFAPDATIIDISITGINGVETAISIRDLRPKCWIVLLGAAGTAMNAIRDAMLRGYFFDIVSRSAQTELLLSRLNSR